MTLRFVRCGAVAGSLSALAFTLVHSLVISATFLTLERRAWPPEG
jgi:hypothetical protein